MRLSALAFVLFAGIYVPAQYGGWGIYGPYGRPPEGAYDLPPCNPRFNPDCGRFSWEGPRARQWRWENHPMMPDAPRGYPGAPYEGPPPYNPDDE
jgi:hypothetical protein